MNAVGFEIFRGVFDEREVVRFREEADLVAKRKGSACVRHLRSRSKLFYDLAVSERISAFISEGVVPVRSILFDKTAGANWPVGWHQDLTVAVRERVDVEGYGPWSVKDECPHVQPPLNLLESMMTVRVHLDETSVENGALRVVPRSHLKGKIDSGDIAEYVNDAVVTCECHPGDVLIMSPLILHSSRRAVVASRRRVLHFEYAEEGFLAGGLKWFEK